MGGNKWLYMGGKTIRVNQKGNGIMHYGKNLSRQRNLILDRKSEGGIYKENGENNNIPFSDGEQ